MTALQIATYARQAGFRDPYLTMAVSIALAESGGNATVINSVGDTGLWQINQPIHNNYSYAWLKNPFNNATAAYKISNGGTSWRPWCTAYSDGACGTKGGGYLAQGSPYQKYVGQASMATGSAGGALGGAAGATSGGGGGGSTTVPSTINGHKAWWTFPRIDNLGGVEPFGGFPKPDSNIQIPAGYAVEALLPGTISGIDTSSAWGASVTVKLDRPINSLATHTAYLHLRCDIQVRTGQHVSFGQLLAYNGLSQACGSQKVPLGFALYAGDMYGSGSAWSYMTKSNLNGGPLDPVPLLNSARSGSMSVQPGGGGDLITGGTTTSVAGTYTPLLEQVHETLINTPGFYGIALALDEAEQFPGWIDLTTKQPDVTILGQDTGVALPDVNGELRSIGATITDNFLPFAIRGGMTLAGLTLMFLLFAKLVEGPVKTIAPLVIGAVA